MQLNESVRNKRRTFRNRVVNKQTIYRLITRLSEKRPSLGPCQAPYGNQSVDRLLVDNSAQKAQKLTRKIKIKAPNPLRRDVKCQKRVVEPVGSEVLSGVASTAPPVTTRHGHNVKIPGKYK